MFKKILFATDYSSTSERAAGYVIRLAHIFNARVFIVHVIHTTGFDDVDEEMASFYEELIRKAEDIF